MPCWLNDDNSNPDHHLGMYVLSMQNNNVHLSIKFYGPFQNLCLN